MYEAKIQVPYEKIANAIIGAIEGGSTYWMQDFLMEETGAPLPEGSIWYAEPRFYQYGFKIKANYDDPDLGEGNAKGSRVLTMTDFEKGIQIMAEKYPRHFSDLMNETDDAITHDVLMQCIVLGELVYG